MRIPVVSGLALALVVLVSGCGDKKSLVTQDSTEPENPAKPETTDTPDTHMRLLVSATNELADLYESVTDLNSALKAKSRLEVLTRRLKQIEAKGKELNFDDLPPQQREALDKQYRDAMERAVDRVIKAKTKPSPEVQRFLAEVERNSVLK
jgi:hypothetical protein